MARQINFLNTNSVLFFLGCAVVIHWVLLYLNPVAPLDCPWSNSNAFNALNGEWMFNSYSQNINNRLYGLVFLPFFYFIKGKYSIFILFELIKIAYIILIVKILKNKMSPVVLVFLIAFFFLDKEVNIYREELFLSFVLTIFYWRYHHRHVSYFGEAMVLFIILIPLHPVAAIAHSIFYIIFEVNTFVKLKRHFNTQRIFVYIGVLLLLGIYFISTPLGQSTIARGEGKLNADLFASSLMFLKMSFPFFLFLILLVSCSTSDKRIYYIGGVFLFLVLFKCGGHYYFIYLFSYLMLVVLKVDRIILPAPVKIGASFLLMCSVYLTLIHPIVVYTESKDYISTISSVFREVENINCSDKTKNIYISNNFVMPIIHNSNVRMTLDALPHVDIDDYQLAVGDEIYLVSKKELNQFGNSIYFSKSQVTQLVPPSNGVLSLSFLYQKRVNEFGLWRCTIIR